MNIVARSLLVLGSWAPPLATSVAAQQAPPAEMPADSPLDPMADIGVDWPKIDAEPSDAETPAAQEAGEARRYKVVLEGLEALSATPAAERFASLSVLKAGEKDPANSAQIDRRIREDSRLLESILRASGHYDARIESEVEADGATGLRVRLIAIPGTLYRFSEVDVKGLEETGEKAPAFSAVLGVAQDDAVDADDVLSGAEALRRSLGETGFPFAKVSEPEVVVDHDTRSASIAIQVDPGGERKFGAIRVTGTKPPFDARHVNRIARFDAGQPYDRVWLDDLRRALIATGVVGTVNVTPVPAADPALADIEVAIEPGPPRTISGELGYGTGEGVRAEASWTHRNLIGAEGAFTVKGVAGTREQEFGISLRKSNFRARDVVLNARLGAANTNLPAFEARTVEFGFGLERQSNIIWHKRWTWSAAGELLATDERDMTANALNPRQTFLIAALPLSLGYDRSNDLLDPVRGFRLGARVAPEISLRNGSNAYLRVQLDASGYLPVSDRVTLAGRVRAGSILGAKTLTLAPSRRFYAGGGGSVRGFGFQRIGPLDAAGDPMGGRSLAEFSLEARVRWREFGIVPFLDGGNIYADSSPGLKGFRYGAGLGLRYHSQFGPIRVDVGTPINRRTGDTRVTVFVSLGQAF